MSPLWWPVIGAGGIGILYLLAKIYKLIRNEIREIHLLISSTDIVYEAQD